MKRLPYLVILFAAVLAASAALSGCTKPPSEKTPGNPVEKPANAKEPAGASNRNGGCTVRGEAIIDDFEGQEGNLFLFILEDFNVTGEIQTVANLLVPSSKVKASIVEFELRNVPPGEWAITAVWDKAAPYCDTSKPYCEFSARDSIGMSETFNTGGNNTLEGIEIKLF